ATDANGCEGTDDIYITVNANPVVTITADPGETVCEGTTVTLDAGDGFASYLWSTGETTQAIDATSAGTYSVTVTDANGCEGTDEINITVNTNPMVTITADPGETVCEGTTVTLDAGAGFTSYLWGTGEETRTIAVTTTGTYSVTVTDANGCEGTDDIDITMCSDPDPEITAEPGAGVCCGTTVTLDAGDGFASYLWSTGETTQTIDATATGWFSVTVTDAHGCRGDDSIEIMVCACPGPRIFAMPAAAVCHGTTVTLDAGPGFGGYLWSTGATTQMIDVTTSGTYTVTVADFNDCRGNDEIVVTLYDDPAPVITASPAAAVCADTTVTLDAGEGFTDYEWSTGESTQTIDVTVTGTYSVTVTDAHGCQGAGDIDVTVYDKTEQMITVDPGTEICEGQTATLDAGAGFSGYEWSTGATTQAIEATASGPYSVTVTDANGCQCSAATTLTVVARDTWYADADGDGFGNADESIQACDRPAGYVSDNTDCDDTDATVNPGASEVADGKDNDCDGATDEDAPPNPSPVLKTWFRDADGDGYGNPDESKMAVEQPPGYVADGTDPNDEDPTEYPGSPGICADGIDNDGDGVIDGQDLDCIIAKACGACGVGGAGMAPFMLLGMWLMKTQARRRRRG
ncbi:MAG: hypothetical protein JXQ75_11090, partial [Phycisphaerae bacterium]|nr:hypothetical protein [Phycisphaerae bacterium]